MTEKAVQWPQRISHWLPSRHVLASHPWLKPVAGRLLDQQHWRFQHEAVARGVAVGTFWAFVMPVAQVVVAAAHCTFWRANIPAAAAMTMVTNPLTIGFWLWLAYELGGLVMGVPLPSSAPRGDGVLAYLQEYGWPTVLGMGIFAIGGAVTGYVAVKLIWRWRIAIKWRGRRQRT